jgi:hypothetical protein
MRIVLVGAGGTHAIADADGHGCFDLRSIA